MLSSACSVAQSCLTLCDLPWTVTCQAPLSMGFFRQEYWSGLLLQGSFPPSDRTCVSCTEDGFFTCWAIRKAPTHQHLSSVKKPGMPQNILHTKHRTALHTQQSSTPNTQLAPRLRNLVSKPRKKLENCLRTHLWRKM